VDKRFQSLGACISRVHYSGMKLIAYARVFTSGQTLNAQLEQLRAHGCDLTFQETMSSTRAEGQDNAQITRVLGVSRSTVTRVQ
jgi:hypothetical protein